VVPTAAASLDMAVEFVIEAFAVVVIGGLGSILGSVVAGFAIGVASALCNLYLPALSQTLVFIVMAAVLLWRPAGLLGREEAAA
jgi:branched-chain amino acid transport system permease protein